MGVKDINGGDGWKHMYVEILGKRGVWFELASLTCTCVREQTGSMMVMADLIV